MDLFSRREFLNRSAILSAAAASLGASGATAADDRPVAANARADRLRVAVVGVRSRGMSHVGGFLNKNVNCEITTVCDCDEAPSVIRSPSRLSYRIDNLPPDAQSRVREAFKDPPRLTLQYCRLRDGVYAFQMSELVPRSIRIGGPGSPFPSPRCSCAAARDLTPSESCIRGLSYCGRRWG